MEKEIKQSNEWDKKYAAACGLYCKACSLFIATTEDPERLKNLAALFQSSEESIKCYGCRSDKRSPYCIKCKISVCTKEQGIDFCSQCDKYPCDDLKQFQAAMPHRLELWNDLARIKTAGYKQWLKEVQENYACPQCKTINSAYDLKCRKCGETPGSHYVAKHKEAIEKHLMHK